MKQISFVVYDLSDNTLARVYPIAKILSKRYKVQIIGPVLGADIYSPYKSSFEYTSYKFRRDKSRIFELFYFTFWFFRNIQADLLVVFKPRLTSLGVASLVKFFKKVPLVLDIDDFETAAFYEQNRISQRILTLFRYKSFNDSLLVNLLIERLVLYSNTVMVSSSFLQRRYGGTILCHGADDIVFNPNNYSKPEIRTNLGIRCNEVILLFAGVVRAHKGLDSLLAAIKVLNRSNIKLMIVGFDHKNTICQSLLENYSSFIIPIPPVDHSKIPSFLAACDIVVLLQKDTVFARAQIPAKVFEAMSMGKTVIATDVSDLRVILGDDRVIISPDIDSNVLAGLLKNLIDENFMFADVGWSLRKRHSEFYNWTAMENILTQMLASLKF